jgi:hypothetical protein
VLRAGDRSIPHQVTPGSKAVASTRLATFIDDGYDLALLRRDDPAVLEFVTALQATGRTVTRVIELDPE